MISLLEGFIDLRILARIFKHSTSGQSCLNQSKPSFTLLWDIADIQYMAKLPEDEYNTMLTVDESLHSKNRSLLWQHQ
jgi:hypothetical protein